MEILKKGYNIWMKYLKNICVIVFHFQVRLSLMRIHLEKPLFIANGFFQLDLNLMYTVFIYIGYGLDGRSSKHRWFFFQYIGSVFSHFIILLQFQAMDDKLKTTHGSL